MQVQFSCADLTRPRGARQVSHKERDVFYLDCYKPLQFVLSPGPPIVPMAAVCLPQLQSTTTKPPADGEDHTAMATTATLVPSSRYLGIPTYLPTPLVSIAIHP